MRIHREGWGFLSLVLLVFGGIDAIAYYTLPQNLWLLPYAVTLCFFIFFVQFFRNPYRTTTLNPEAVISPADGKVVVIEKVFEKEYFKDERIQISVFMSPLNVHINRVPISGKLEYYRYHKGKYLVAFHPKSSELNERNTSVITDIKNRKILLRQIAGAVARRICYYPKEGDQLKQGEEIGFIKFGSRCDIFLPLDSKINVQLNELVTGGKSVLGFLS